MNLIFAKYLYIEVLHSQYLPIKIKVEIRLLGPFETSSVEPEAFIFNHRLNWHFSLDGKLKIFFVRTQEKQKRLSSFVLDPRVADFKESVTGSQNKHALLRPGFNPEA